MKFSLAAVVVAALLTPVAMTSAQAKTAKECTAEWRANKEANQAAKITEKAYVEKCRSADAAAPASTAPASPAAAAPVAPKTAAPAAPNAPAAKSSATPATGANQFASDAQAKAKCPADTVVWVNLSSKIYHFAGKKDYGNTKSGTYMCEKDAIASGSRAAKNEKHP